jgi:FkbM family methyltransferase
MLARFAWRLDPHEVVYEMAPGVKMKIRLDRDEDLAYWTNRYEQHDDVHVFVSLLRPGMVVVDVGANIGMYAMLSARAVAPGGRVFAFEPVPGVYSRLIENLTISGIGNVAPHQLALSDTRGTAPLYLGRNDSMGSLYRAQTSAMVEVATEALDDFLEREEVTAVDAVKIDAEGAEMRIIRGMRRLLARSDRPMLLVEHNYNALRAAGSSANELFTAIVGHGYAPHVVERGQLKRVQALAEPFQSREEAYTNYVFLPDAVGVSAGASLNV